MCPQNWDDDFDFEDLDEPKNKKKTQQKKKTNIYDDDDFFDQDKNDKLPTITKNNVSSKQIPNKRNSAKRNPYVQNMDLKSNVYQDQYEQEIAEEPVSYKQTKPVHKNNVKNVSNNQNDEDYYQDIQDIPENKNITSSKAIGKTQKKLPSEKEQADSYENDDFEDAYGEDFQEIEIQSPKKNIPKAVQKKQVQKKITSSVQPIKRKEPPKPPSRSKQKAGGPEKRNLTSIKPQKAGLVRENSRKSLKSVNSNRQRVNSRARPPINKMSTNNSFISHKYTNQILKAFPEVNIHELPQDKVSKMNDRVRATIKRFNDQLNNLINKNMLYLKSKKNQKTVTVDSRLKVYEQQKKNNQTMIQYMQKQFDKLCGREGQLREEQYQLLTEKKIEEIKQSIKETQKNITKLKFQVKNQGNKLSKKGQDKRLAQQLHHLKTTLIQAKKDEEKNDQKLTKLDQQSVELDGKINDVQYKISQIIDMAKEKGIQLETKEQFVKKYEEIKKKVDISRNHRSKLQNLLKTKSDIISHQKQQIRINIKNSEMEIKNLYQSIGHSHTQSVKVVEKAKMNPKINQSITGHLDQILRSLEQAQQLDSFSVRSESNKSQASQRPLKNIDVGNMEKSEKIIESVNKNEKSQQDSSKPNLMKKKPKFSDMPVQDKNNQYNGRIWKDQQQLKKQEKKNKIVLEQEDKKKPFSLKRNKVTSQNKLPQQDNTKTNNKQTNGLKLDIPDVNSNNKQQLNKKDQVPTLSGPRMMKFKRRNNGSAQEKDDSKNISKQIQPEKLTFNEPKNNTLSLKINIEPQKNQQPAQIKPFVPKRFNLRNKLQQKKEDAYIPSIENKNQAEQEKKQVEQIKQINNGLKFNLGDVQDPYANKKPKLINKIEQNKIQTKISEPEQKKIVVVDKQDQDVKPKFTLRLRDRKKNNDSNADQGYMPSGTQKVINIQNKQQSNNIQKTEMKKQQPSINPYNPYAQNAEVPRRKEGPVKKIKPQVATSKPKINIYEQAQEAEGLNQFVKEAVVQQNLGVYQQAKVVEQKQPDLNDLLGLNNKNKKNNNDDLTDLIGDGAPKKKNKKKNQFFDDMDF